MDAVHHRVRACVLKQWGCGFEESSPVRKCRDPPFPPWPCTRNPRGLTGRSSRPRRYAAASASPQYSCAGRRPPGRRAANGLAHPLLTHAAPGRQAVVHHALDRHLYPSCAELVVGAKVCRLPPGPAPRHRRATNG
eukprot:4713430-Prymnesium_polylepis.1